MASYDPQPSRNSGAVSSNLPSHDSHSGQGSGNLNTIDDDSNHVQSTLMTSTSSPNVSKAKTGEIHYQDLDGSYRPFETMPPAHARHPMSSEIMPTPIAAMQIPKGSTRNGSETQRTTSVSPGPTLQIPIPTAEEMAVTPPMTYPNQKIERKAHLDQESDKESRAARTAAVEGSDKAEYHVSCCSCQRNLLHRSATFLHPYETHPSSSFQMAHFDQNDDDVLTVPHSRSTRRDHDALEPDFDIGIGKPPSADWTLNNSVYMPSSIPYNVDTSSVSSRASDSQSRELYSMGAVPRLSRSDAQRANQTPIHDLYTKSKGENMCSAYSQPSSEIENQNHTVSSNPTTQILHSTLQQAADSVTNPDPPYSRIHTPYYHNNIPTRTASLNCQDDRLNASSGPCANITTSTTSSGPGRNSRVTMESYSTPPIVSERRAGGLMYMETPPMVYPDPADRARIVNGPEVNVASDQSLMCNDGFRSGSGGIGYLVDDELEADTHGTRQGTGKDGQVCCYCCCLDCDSEDCKAVCKILIFACAVIINL
ncbi:hypothetical protein CVT24_013355 [Panaeolus cyanescens]|uniref:Uncharacterized protein n=1 Tax=Panaeolus cyanescens TaxID=181874 RepID=A0A409WAG9_9AGAR|nr:hypothetical protein CVT24_013355 [Panaeolus cyanescens]